MPIDSSFDLDDAVLIRHLPAFALFAAAVETGSLAAAARRFGLHRSAATRQLAALEAALQLRLLHRYADGCMPTEAGRAAYASSRDLLAVARQTLAQGQAGNTAVAGPVRLMAPGDWLRHCLMPLLPAFLVRYPAVWLDLAATADDSPGDVDLQFRLQAGADGATELCRYQLQAVAAPILLAGEQAPGSPAWLATQTLVQLGGEETVDPPVWQHCDGSRLQVSPAAVIQSSDLEFALAVATSGAAVAVLPQYLLHPLRSSGVLISLFPDWQPAAMAILSCRTRQPLPPPAAALLAHLQEALR